MDDHIDDPDAPTLPYHPGTILSLIDQADALAVDLARQYGTNMFVWPPYEVAKSTRLNARISAMMMANMQRAGELGWMPPEPPGDLI